VSDVYLRDVIEADLEVFWDQQQDELANQMAAFTVEDPADRAAFDDRWRRIFADPTLVKKTIVADDVVVGNIACHRWFGEPELAYGVDRAHWGKGIATAALRLLLSEVEERPLHARVAYDNAGSIRVLEKCGFRQVGSEVSYANARGREIEEAIFVLD
jgi:RimJ/RimL family protein N-acetyltransferase